MIIVETCTSLLGYDIYLEYYIDLGHSLKGKS